jgi:hypothetical protein
MRIPGAIAATAVAALLTTQCSLLAPSDQALMGSDKATDAGDGGDASDAMDSSGGGSSSGSSSSGSSSGGTSSGGCGQVDDCCSPGECCSGLACETNSGICIPCQAAGATCLPSDNVCCSGSCEGHTCQ